jgi:hypothetical protein
MGMSLAAILLGVPGRLRKLRGLNVGVTPLTPDGGAGDLTVLETYFIRETTRPFIFSHALTEQAGQNNASQSSVEVASLTGPGAINGIWVQTRTKTTGINALFDYGLEVLVDGVDIIPAGWKHTDTANGYYVGATCPLGGARIMRDPYDVFYFPAPFVIPFKSTLVVNLIHNETEATTTLLTSVWVNAWKTE